MADDLEGMADEDNPMTLEEIKLKRGVDAYLDEQYLHVDTVGKTEIYECARHTEPVRLFKGARGMHTTQHHGSDLQVWLINNGYIRVNEG